MHFGSYKYSAIARQEMASPKSWTSWLVYIPNFDGEIPPSSWHSDGQFPPTTSQETGWLVVWTPLKNISQLGWLFPIYGKIKNVPNHQPDGIVHYEPTILGYPMTMETANSQPDHPLGFMPWPKRSVTSEPSGQLTSSASEKIEMGPGYGHCMGNDTVDGCEILHQLIDGKHPMAYPMAYPMAFTVLNV